MMCTYKPIILTDSANFVNFNYGLRSDVICALGQLCYAILIILLQARAVG
jgi:hypothetical protein